MNRSILDLLICPACHSSLESRDRHLFCPECSDTYPIVDGIPDLRLKSKPPESGVYRTDTLNNLVAGVYDFAAPFATLTAWRCSPLHYIDVTHVALGRANHGIFVAAPIGTGLVVEQALASYYDLTIIGLDSSWGMLRQAQKRFKKHKDIKVQLICCDLQAIPLKDHIADSVQSLNGLHNTLNRIEMLNNFARIGKVGAYLSGSALVRGVVHSADFALTQFEKWGIVPFLRTSEFLLREMADSEIDEIRFTSAGAVLFWEGSVGV